MEGAPTFYPETVAYIDPSLLATAVPFPLPLPLPPPPAPPTIPAQHGRRWPTFIGGEDPFSLASSYLVPGGGPEVASPIHDENLLGGTVPTHMSASADAQTMTEPENWCGPKDLKHRRTNDCDDGNENTTSRQNPASESSMSTRMSTRLSQAATTAQTTPLASPTVSTNRDRPPRKPPTIRENEGDSDEESRDGDGGNDNRQRAANGGRLDGRQRNRIAAAKSRRKRNDATGDLETVSLAIFERHKYLTMQLEMLQAEVSWLDGQLRAHTHCGCHTIRRYYAVKELLRRRQGEEAIVPG